jgi:hypothetical protein
MTAFARAPLQERPERRAPAGPARAAAEAPARRRAVDETGGAGPAPAAEPASRGPARPTGLIQILTPMTSPHPIVSVEDLYGFMLLLRFRSTSGQVADLQAQGETLRWREFVTYSRNDFSHRFRPENPTVLPVGGAAFGDPTARRVGQNLLEFPLHVDRHMMPKQWVRAEDFEAAETAEPGRRSLPAEMHSRQLYQYSPDGGARWLRLTGAFNIRRKLFREGGRLRFRTSKSGVHSKTEPYKP